MFSLGLLDWPQTMTGNRPVEKK